VESCAERTADVRQLIEDRLAAYAPAADPLARTLADIRGTASPELIARLRDGRPAAVLLGLIERGDRLHVLFTRRARHLSVHAGQICFPGGRLETRDSGVTDAALREAQEEIGLEAGAVTVAGQLDSFLTVTGFLVTPIVGFIDPRFEPVPDAGEVDAVFDVPLGFFLEPGNVIHGTRERMGVSFQVYEFRYDEHCIWGATAAILMNLKQVIDI
jgi:8-oxo-dGTP pyrophosphatase MutT (NUDIX family)